MLSGTVASPLAPRGRAIGVRSVLASPRAQRRQGMTAPAGRQDDPRGRLMAAAQGGDEGAYRRLLADCLPLVRVIVRRQGVPPDRAEDAVQDVLLTIHRVRHTYDPNRPFDAWLHAIAQRRAIDVQRSTGRRSSRELHDPIAYETAPADGPGPDGDIDAQRRAALLHAAIARLPAGQREAVEHVAIGERSLAEASALTQRSEGAIKVNLHRAIRALRGLLGPTAGPGD